MVFKFLKNISNRLSASMAKFYWRQRIDGETKVMGIGNYLMLRLACLVSFIAEVLIYSYF